MKFSFFLIFLLSGVAAFAASVRGVVTDVSGAKVKGAVVALVSDGKTVASTISTNDGGFEILTGVEGRFFLVVSARSFRQLQTPDFYAGRMDSVEKPLVLEPEWVRASIVVTATGIPTPQGETSETTSVIGPEALASFDGLGSGLLLMPGVAVAQVGQRGAQTSLFVRGGNSTANKVQVDGVDATDLGGTFDFGPFMATAIESAEVYRGPNSTLYGAGAASSVINLKTAHGTTPFPSILFRGDAGNLSASREELTVAGAHNKWDYLGAYNWLQTANNLPNDEFHSGTVAGNLGWQPNGNTQLRATAHYGIDATGVPNAWDFYHVADSETEKDQDLYLSAGIDNQTTASLRQSAQYGAARKREQSYQWAQMGMIDAFGDGLGKQVTITGANGYSVTGQAILDYSGIYPYSYQLVSNRDQLNYQASYAFTPHLTALAGFRFEDERGAEVIPAYYVNEAAERTNYDYTAAVHGDFKGRFFYTLGGSLERYSLFGTQTSPRAGLAWYALKPKNGLFSGTKAIFNYGDAVREPKLTEQFALTWSR